jgi:hypothetical protein
MKSFHWTNHTGAGYSWKTQNASLPRDGSPITRTSVSGSHRTYLVPTHSATGTFRILHAWEYEVNNLNKLIGSLKGRAIMYIHLTRFRMCLLPKLTWNNEFFKTMEQRLSMIYICTILRTLQLLRSTKPSGLSETSDSVQRDTANWLLLRMIINACCDTEFSIEIAEITSIVVLVDALADDACHVIAVMHQYTCSHWSRWWCSFGVNCM